MSKKTWTGFAKKSPQERLDQLLSQTKLSQDSQAILTDQQLLELEVANQMAENVIGRMALPLSLLPDLLVDGQHYQVPMVTEEPSVVAAASFAAGIINRSGGFETQIHDRKMIGQLALYDVPDKDLAQQAILKHKENLLALANQAYPSIVKRGGGACDLRVDSPSEDFLVLYLTVDTQEAMGANMVNTMMEALKEPVEILTGATSLMAILSNYATQSLVTASCRIDLRYLSRDRAEAETIAQKMTLASRLAQVDPYRASTHNKGIFNGLDALVLATGNDWRAIEAGCHTYACQSGQYRGLTTWNYDSETNQLAGEITLPLPIGTKGGSIGLNPSVQAAMDILGHPSAKSLAAIMASLGLAQNFAALRALVTTGIQSGHMKLQAKSLALLAGASETELPLLLDKLLQAKHRNLETAQNLLADLRKV